jgi:hypothetical protein
VNRHLQSVTFALQNLVHGIGPNSVTALIAASFFRELSRERGNLTAKNCRQCSDVNR